jgi:transcriptional regulator with XRE-family HTH domain
MENYKAFIKAVAANIARVRQEKGVSARQLSLQIGKSADYICKIEKGETNIRINSLLKIAAALQINTAELFNKNAE